MAISKIIQANVIRPNGAAVTKVAWGAAQVLDRGGYIALSSGAPDDYMPSWASTGHVIDSNGVMLFDNIDNSGSLETVLLVNRGSNVGYVGFNSSEPEVSKGFPLSSGESMQHRGAISQIWAITQAGQTSIAGIGLYNHGR